MTIPSDITVEKPRSRPPETTGAGPVKSTPRRIRGRVQLGIFVLTAAIGLQFFIYVNQATDLDL